jgi:hypothetical protein
VRATQAAAPVPPGIEAAAPVPPAMQAAVPVVAVPVAPGMQAAAPVIAVYLALEHARLTVLVWDCCPQRPVRRAHDDDAETGRGLELVQALSDSWGSCAAGLGKVTWARFDLNRQTP